jgi:hypothetical protein
MRQAGADLNPKPEGRRPKERDPKSESVPAKNKGRKMEAEELNRKTLPLKMERWGE